MYEITQIQAGANCYLVTQEDASILVDTGVKGFEEKILKHCEAEYGGSENLFWAWKNGSEQKVGVRYA